MTSTAFTICLILAAVMVMIHPAFCIPFLIAVYLLAGKGRMELDSNTSIIIGIVGFFVVLFVFAAIRQSLK
ncbi:TPA: hypothetical protein SMF67_000869 [Serratia marcescens]|uniref:hypothetical protein n=1 Tax=Serratia marcescens TaxID=615 RepID=UPI0013D9034D|nr:hypothetical protein [Serratia marcescens]MDU7468921.1 hypothetical protein [Serratia marcescens]WAZ00987.1 hypothetical protein O3T14_18875 [Serratia marcescens]HEJ7090243.1 hypothetical protein [Serratia marcescens]